MYVQSLKIDTYPKGEVSKQTLTLDIMIPAILIRIRGPLSRRYRKSTPFQNDTKYLLIWKIINR